MPGLAPPIGALLDAGFAPLAGTDPAGFTLPGLTAGLADADPEGAADDGRSAGLTLPAPGRFLSSPAGLGVVGATLDMQFPSSFSSDGQGGAPTAKTLLLALQRRHARPIGFHLRLLVLSRLARLFVVLSQFRRHGLQRFGARHDPVLFHSGHHAAGVFALIDRFFFADLPGLEIHPQIIIQ